MVSLNKSTVLVLGFFLIVVGAIFLLITQPAGTPGSNPSGGIADVSEDVYPYLVEGMVLLMVGIVVVAVGLVRK